MNRDYEQTLQHIERLIHMYSQNEKNKRTYGTDQALSCTEIHVIDEIGRRPGIGVKALAEKKGVTEGAVSQLVKKLIKKDLISKEISKESDAKVCLSLTKNGEICYGEHKNYHEQANRKWYGLFEELTEREYQSIQDILRKAEKNMESK
jgi:DNA-binding MarR family transcriptional regulator